MKRCICDLWKKGFGRKADCPVHGNPASQPQEKRCPECGGTNSFHNHWQPNPIQPQECQKPEKTEWEEYLGKYGGGDISTGVAKHIVSLALFQQKSEIREKIEVYRDFHKNHGKREEVNTIDDILAILEDRE